MKKTISKILLGGLLGASALTFNGCQGLATAIYQDTPFGEIDMARQRARAPQVNVYGEDDNNNNNNFEEYNRKKAQFYTIIDLDTLKSFTWKGYDGGMDYIKEVKEFPKEGFVIIDENNHQKKIKKEGDRYILKM